MVDAARGVDPDASLSEVIDRLETDPAYCGRQPGRVRRLHPGDPGPGPRSARRPPFRRRSRDTESDRQPGPARLCPRCLLPGADRGLLPAGRHLVLVRGERQQLPLWSEVSTAYHEGFPGHHLQVGTVMTLRENLSRAHRLLIWYSGFGEGWALYTERLMDELGTSTSPTTCSECSPPSKCGRAGSLSTSGVISACASRTRPCVAPGEIWSYDSAVETLHRVAGIPLDIVAFRGQALPRVARAGHLLQSRGASHPCDPRGSPEAPGRIIQSQGIPSDSARLGRREARLSPGDHVAQSRGLIDLASVSSRDFCRVG